MHKTIIELWETHQDTALLFGKRAAMALLIVAAGMLIIGITNRIGRKAAGKLHVDETLASVLRLVVRYGTIIVALIMLLDTFGFNTTSFIAILGAAGVAVGLALKDILGNMAAGITLLFLRYYKTGDYIEAGSAAGVVRDMDLLATTLETPDGVYISAPNALLLASPIKNYTRSGKRRMEIVVQISYHDSIDAAFHVMREIAREESRFLVDPAPQVMVKSLADNGVQLMLRAWAAHDDYWPVFWEQSQIIKERIQAAGLTIPLPQRDIRIVRD
ncbi:MAG: mechanosensitive ion channel family protein [Spirochaetaceae bacterium]|jgi:small conductance mechanosensitive channel|nr:mechanosensitive ion channel family protein [Spirochaetaceae bacterium]